MSCVIPLKLYWNGCQRIHVYISSGNGLVLLGRVLLLWWSVHMCRPKWSIFQAQVSIWVDFLSSPQIARFLRPTWGAPGADRTQVGPMLAPWTLLLGVVAKGSLIHEAPLINRSLGGIQRVIILIPSTKMSASCPSRFHFIFFSSNGSGLVYIQDQHYKRKSTEECYSCVNWKADA